MKNIKKDILSKCSVLIVDDDSNLRSIFKKTLLSYVNCIYEASNGNEALDIYNSKKPDIVITDMKMPLMDGLMFVSVLRQLNKKIPIVVISGYSNSDELIKLSSLKLVEYLVKPVNFEQLISALNRCAIEIDENGLIEVKLTPDLIYSFSKKFLIFEDKNVSLTPNEISIIELFIENENQLVTKSQIEDIVYENKYVSDSALNTLVSKLRKKMEINIINSVPSHGYIMVRKS